MSLCAARPWRLPSFVVVGSHASVLGCPQRHGQPDSGGCFLSSSCGVESALGCPRRCGLPYLSVRHPSSSWHCVLRCWANHVDVGCPTSAFASLRRRAVACLGVGLPTTMWAALVRRSPPLVLVWCRTSVLGYPHHCGPPYCGVRLVVVRC